jgi:hypothetical protein
MAENTAAATLTFNLGPGHPLENEVERLFLRFRAEAEQLRARIDLHNQTKPPTKLERVILYLGMCEDRPRVIESPSTALPTPNAEVDSDDDAMTDP